MGREIERNKNKGDLRGRKKGGEIVKKRILDREGRKRNREGKGGKRISKIESGMVGIGRDMEVS